MRQRILFIVTLICCCVTAGARQYQGTTFGLKSDGTTDNTGSLQKAIDYISTESPGDTLVLYVGRYLTGTIYLKSNVTIRLSEGAVLVGVTTALSYDSVSGTTALLVADGQQKIEIYGTGVIEGNGKKTLEATQAVKYLSPEAPSLISISNSKNIKIRGIMLQNSAADGIVVKNSRSVTVDKVTIFGKAVEGSNGVVASLNSELDLTNMYIDVSGEAIVSSSNSASKAEACKKPDGSCAEL